jgi:hypothetical protein
MPFAEGNPSATHDPLPGAHHRRHIRGTSRISAETYRVYRAEFETAETASAVSEDAGTGL